MGKSWNERKFDCFIDGLLGLLDGLTPLFWPLCSLYVQPTEPENNIFPPQYLLDQPGYLQLTLPHSRILTFGVAQYSNYDRELYTMKSDH